MIELEHKSPAAAHWSTQQYGGMFANRDSERPERFILVVEEADEVRMETTSGASHRLLAFLVAHRIDNEWELENIVVAQSPADEVSELACCVSSSTRHVPRMAIRYSWKSASRIMPPGLFIESLVL